VDFLQAVALVDVRDGIASLCQFSRLFGVSGSNGHTKKSMGHHTTKVGIPCKSIKDGILFSLRDANPGGVASH